MAIPYVPIRELRSPCNGRPEWLVQRLHPARSNLAPGGVPAEDLAVVFNSVSFLHIIVCVDALLDGGGDLSVPALNGIIIYMCFQLA